MQSLSQEVFKDRYVTECPKIGMSVLRISQGPSSYVRPSGLS